MSGKLDKKQEEKIKSLLMSGDKSQINQALTLLDAFGMGTQEKDSELIREVTEYLYEEGSIDNDYLERSDTLRKEMVRFKGGVVKDLVDLVDSIVENCWSNTSPRKKLTGSSSHTEKGQWSNEELWFVYGVDGDYQFDDDNWYTAHNVVKCIRNALVRMGLIQKSKADDAVYPSYGRDSFSLQITLDLTQINFNKLKLSSRSATMRKLTKRQASRKLNELYGQLTNTKKQANEKYNYYFEVEAPHGKIKNERDMAKWLMENDLYNIEDAIFDYTDDYYSDMQGEVIIKSIKVRDMEIYSDQGTGWDSFYGTADITWTFKGSMSKYDGGGRRYATRKMTKRQASKKLDELHTKVTKSARFHGRNKKANLELKLKNVEIDLDGIDVGGNRRDLMAFIEDEWDIYEDTFWSYAEDQYDIQDLYPNWDGSISAIEDVKIKSIDIEEMDDDGIVEGTVTFDVTIFGRPFGKSARFSEGEKGRKEFQKWKKEQGEDFQEEWDENKKESSKMTPKQASRALDRLHAKTFGTDRKATRKQAGFYQDFLKDALGGFLGKSTDLNDNRVHFEGPRDSEFEQIIVQWDIARDAIKVNFMSAYDPDDFQSASIEKVSLKSGKDIAKELKDLIENFDMSAKWEGYDNWRMASTKMTKRQASQKLDRLHARLTNRKATTRRRR